MKAMPNIIAFKPKHQLENEKNLQDFINRAKNDLTIYEEQDLLLKVRKMDWLCSSLI